MTTEPKYVILGRDQDPTGFVGRTESEWSGLFSALAIADPAARGAAVTAAIGAAVPPTRLDVKGIYKRAHARAKGAKSPVRLPRAGGRKS